ncbi:DUF4190 domain-containing protein [Tepidibacillus marianensis]|uniref:DUF4190 domain-containing protein n=1 Tax=Tepidibacillus marianensis TaxID=3131995 RepID=UPI0030D14729
MSEEQNMSPKTNGKAIAALVLGIVSLMIPYVGLIVGIVGIVYAKKAIAEIAQTQDNGKGMAVAGLVTSIISVALYAILIIILIIAGVTFYSM